MAPITSAAIALSLAFAAAGCAHAPQSVHPDLVEVWRLDEGLRNPESVVYDPARKVLYVSNMAGRGDARDGVGFISRVRADGTLDTAEWVAGFDAPKGLALVGDRLFTADIQSIAEIDVTTGAVARRFTVPEAVYLNDVTGDAGGRVIVSDARGDALFQVDGPAPALFAKDAAIVRPNGVRAIGADVMVLAGRPGGTGDAGDARRLARIKADGGVEDVASDRADFGGADGVEPDGRGGFFISTNRTGEIVHVTKAGATRSLVTLPTNTADLHYDPRTRRLYVPSAGGGTLTAFAVRWR